MKKKQRKVDVIFMDKGKNKKGVELGMNVIVMAVIALAVLIVVLIVFAGKFGLFSSELNNCESTGQGVCVDSDLCTSQYKGRIIDFKCTGDKKCCISPCTMAGGTCESVSDCKPDNGDFILFADCGQSYTCCKKKIKLSK